MTRHTTTGSDHWQRPVPMTDARRKDIHGPLRSKKPGFFEAMRAAEKATGEPHWTAGVSIAAAFFAIGLMVAVAVGMVPDLIMTWGGL